MAYVFHDPLCWQIFYRLVQADESVPQGDESPWSHPRFRSCKQAALNLLRIYPDAQHICVMPDDCLAHMRMETLLAGRTLIVPAHDGTRVVSIPKTALQQMRGGQHALYIDDLLKAGPAYVGPVDVIVVACLAFNASMRRVYSFEYTRTKTVIESLRGGQIVTPAVGANAPVILVSSDAQEVSGWPDYALGAHEADVVVTATRAIVLGSGAARPFAHLIGEASHTRENNAVGGPTVITDTSDDHV